MPGSKFYKTKIVLEFLSEEPLVDIGGPEDAMNVISRSIDDDLVGRLVTSESEALTKDQMAQALREFGSEPGFFQIEEDDGDDDVKPEAG